MRRSIRIAVGVGVAVLVLATTASAEVPMITAFVREATQSFEPRTTIVPAATSGFPTLSADELSMLSVLADQEGISHEQAIARYGWQDDFGMVANDLENAHPSSYVETAAEDDHVRISFAGDAPPEAVAKLVAFKLPVPIHIRDRMGWSGAEIVEAAERIHFAMPKELMVGTDPGAETGVIRVEASPANGRSVAEARTRIYQTATTDGPLRDAIDQVPPTVSVVITVASYPLVIDY